MGTEASDVLEILARFDQHAIDYWVEGGWGIDGLLGAQNREHGDLDLVIDAPRSADAQTVLARAGFEVIYEDPPGRVSMMDSRGRVVDMAFAVADRYGDRWNLNRTLGQGEPDYGHDSFTYGWIGGKKVGCVGPLAQISHHLGYEIEEVDKFDMALLRDRFQVSVPEVLR